MIIQGVVSYIDLSILQSTLKRLQTHQSYSKIQDFKITSVHNSLWDHKISIKDGYFDEVTSSDVAFGDEHLSTISSTLCKSTKLKHQLDDLSIIYEE